MYVVRMIDAVSPARSFFFFLSEARCSGTENQNKYSRCGRRVRIKSVAWVAVGSQREGSYVARSIGTRTWYSKRMAEKAEEGFIPVLTIRTR
jgi:hypothetical protein